MSKEKRMRKKALREAREKEEGRKIARYVAGALILIFVLGILWAIFA